MNHVTDWRASEEAIAQLMADGERASLLAALDHYSRRVVVAARHAPAPAPDARAVEGALEWLERPVFVCGHQRSGTTLVRDLLDGHPDLLVLPSEGTYLSSFRYVARANPGDANLDRFVADWVRRLVDPNHEPHFKLGRSDDRNNPYQEFAARVFAWHAPLRAARPALARFAPMLALVAGFRDVAAPRSAPRRWVEKTPLNERHRARFARFSEARFVHVVRDPRNALASLLAVYKAAGVRPPHLSCLARDIGESLRAALRATAREPQAYITMRYEDVTADPVRQMQRVCDLLGIAPHEALRTPTVLDLPVRANSSFEQGPAGVIRDAPRAAPLAEDASLQLRVFAADAARAFGYDLQRLSGWRRRLSRLATLPRHWLSRRG